MEIKENEHEYKTLALSENYDGSDLKFRYDISKATYEMDILQTRMLENYLRSDPLFRRAFNQNYTSEFFQALKDKARLKEPFHLSTIGQVRCLFKDSKVLMSNGEFKKIQDIKIGDKVLSPQKDGSYIFSKVIDINSFYSNDNYDIVSYDKFNKKLYSCSYNHEFPIYSYRKYHKNQYIQDITASKKSLQAKNQSKCNDLAITSFLIDKFENRENCKLDPYSLGVYLGDGSCGANFQKGRDSPCRYLRISNSNLDIIERVSKVYPIMSVQKRKGKTIKEIRAYAFSINGDFFKFLESYNLVGKKSGDKFIPKFALYSDMEYRKALLEGLIDTDGYLSKSISYSIVTKSKQLAEDIEFLVYSLGGRSNITKIKKQIKSYNFEGEYFSISFYLGNHIKLNLSNKIKQRGLRDKYAYNSSNRRAFISIKNNQKCLVYGITLDSPSSYFITDNFVITKNSGKSYTSISLAVYMNALQNKRFNVNHICGNAFDFVNKLQSFPKEKLNNSTYLIDEEKQAVYGVGSIARKMKLTDVQNIIAINNISTIMLQPQNFANEDAFYGLKLFGRCFKTKTTRALLYNLQERGHGSGTPVGCVYIPIFTEFLPKYYAEALEHDYLLKKHEWVNKEMRGQGDVLGQLKKDKAREMLQDVTFCNLKSKNDKRTYLALKLGSEFTNTEIEQIVDISVLIQKGMIK